MSPPSPSQQNHLQQELSRACRGDDAGAVIEAIAHGANPNQAAQGQGESPLEICARRGAERAMRELIAQGARVQPNQQRKMAEALLESWAHGPVKIAAQGPLLDRALERFDQFAGALIAAGLQWSAIDQAIQRFDNGAEFWIGDALKLAAWNRVAREWSALNSYREKTELDALAQSPKAATASPRL